MKRLALVAAVAAALTTAGPAAAIDYPGAVRNPFLEAHLPTPVKVFCTQNTNWSFAMLQDREIYLDINTCAALQGQPSQYAFERAAEVLYHEWWHVAFQETNEDHTEEGCYAILRYALRTYWGLTPAQAQADYAEAVQYSPYHPHFTETTVDPLLADQTLIAH